MEENIKVFAVLKIARQYEGEYVFIMPEKAFMSEDESKAKLAAYEYCQNNPLKRGEVLQDENGNPIECLIERGVHEITIDEV